MWWSPEPGNGRETCRERRHSLHPDTLAAEYGSHAVRMECEFLACVRRSEDGRYRGSVECELAQEEPQQKTDQKGTVEGLFDP